MYHTCLFCKQDLGRNEVVEVFPVGRRLAYDAERGRLWVVCPRCERWNLTPLDERWEAIERCEALFRETRLRASTANIGLARLREGLDLVRVGRALRPEMAAWRYGDQFGRRRRRQITATGGVVATVAGALLGGAALGATALLVSGAVELGVWLAVSGRPDRVIARVPGRGPDRVLLTRADLSSVRVWGDGRTLHLHLRRGDEEFAYVGEQAERVGALLTPHINRFGGSAGDVADAVQTIEVSRDSHTFLGEFRRQGREDGRYGPPDLFGRDADRYSLRSLPVAERLALEMALHEDFERRALEGELSELERAWRDAEEIASIADGLLARPGGDAAGARRGAIAATGVATGATE
jgi:hypothetical protein